MEPKEMRVKLKEAGVTCPVSNADVVKKFNEAFSPNIMVGPPPQDMEVIAPVVKLVSSNIYTYIGSGDEPPHMINFMGLQNFVRGTAIEVTNPDVIAKIQNNPSFVKGEYDSDLMFESDEKEKKRAGEQRKSDAKIEALMVKANR